MIEVHPTAQVHPGAVIGAGTSIGAFAIVEDKVVMGKDCRIDAHAMVRSHTTMGDEVKVHPFAVIGGEPQHMKYAGEPTTAVIGNRVTLRECVTVNRGTPFGNNTTIIEDDAFIMAYTHVAHDCIIQEGAIIANSCQLAGHVTIGKKVILGGQSAITQFCRIGDYCYLGGGTILRKDVAPFLTGKGNEFIVQGINTVGMARQGFSPEVISSLKKLYRIFFLQKLTVVQAVEKILMEIGKSEEIENFLNFVETSKAGINR